jgi:hypothetical protein
MTDGSAYFCFLGHGILPGTDWDVWIRQRLGQPRCAVVA